jgi:mercuric ion transport protein
MGAATQQRPDSDDKPSRDSLGAWAAVAASAGAVLAWAACCVLPMALALTGTTVAATALLAGQRTWLTLLAGLLLAAGWLLTWRRARDSRIDQTCRPPSRLNIGLLSASSFLLALALAWSDFIEPKLLHLILAASA